MLAQLFRFCWLMLDEYYDFSIRSEGSYMVTILLRLASFEIFPIRMK